MDTKATYQNDITKYTHLKSYVNSIVNNLTRAISDLSSVDSNVKNKYLVDDNNTPVESRISTLISNMSSTRDYLRDTIIPAIDSAITGTNNKIQKLGEKK